MQPRRQHGIGIQKHMNSPALSPAQLEHLRKHDTPTVCNVIELFAIRPRNSGYMDGRIKACFPELKPMVGYATTATFRSDAPALGNGYANIDKQIETFATLPGPAVVVFQDLDDPVVAATFGEVMCTTYKAFGAAGIITSGAGRDLEQVRAIGFPAFTNGVICSHGYNHTPSLQTPVRVGGIMINPGDLLHGDCNGVTSIPHAIADQIADACDEFMAAEAIVMSYLRGAAPTIAGMTAARAEYKHAVERLTARLRR
jgi:regulator of RNase E activity RraA